MNAVAWFPGPFPGASQAFLTGGIASHLSRSSIWSRHSCCRPCSMYPLLYPWKNFYEDFSVTNSAAFNTFECFRILGLDFPWFVTSVFSVVLYFICLVIYGLINANIHEFLSTLCNAWVKFVPSCSKVCTRLNIWNRLFIAARRVVWTNLQGLNIKI